MVVHFNQAGHSLIVRHYDCRFLRFARGNALLVRLSDLLQTARRLISRF